MSSLNPETVTINFCTDGQFWLEAFTTDGDQVEWVISRDTVDQIMCAAGDALDHEREYLRERGIPA